MKPRDDSGARAFANPAGDYLQKKRGDTFESNRAMADARDPRHG
jgi:hypothetical protein